MGTSNNLDHFLRLLGRLCVGHDVIVLHALGQISYETGRNVVVILVVSMRRSLHKLTARSLYKLVSAVSTVSSLTKSEVNMQKSSTESEVGMQKSSTKSEVRVKKSSTKVKSKGKILVAGSCTRLLFPTQGKGLLGDFLVLVERLVLHLHDVVGSVGLDHEVHHVRAHLDDDISVHHIQSVKIFQHKTFSPQRTFQYNIFSP